MLVGNKCDVESDKRKVPREVGKSFAERFDIPWFEVSAKSGENVDVAFDYLVLSILKVQYIE
jgi:GTPase SAR1 family protein